MFGHFKVAQSLVLHLEPCTFLPSAIPCTAYLSTWAPIDPAPCTTLLIQLPAKIMSTALISADTTTLQLKDHLTYPESGVLSKVIWKDEVCQYSLFCLAANTEISEHTSTRNATVQVVEGTGSLSLNGETIALAPGVFIFMAANAPHALVAAANLAFVLTLSSAS